MSSPATRTWILFFPAAIAGHHPAAAFITSCKCAARSPSRWALTYKPLQRLHSVSAISTTSRPPRAQQPSTSSRPSTLTTKKPLTTLQEANPRNLPEVWINYEQPFFTPSSSNDPDKPPDQDRKVKLGKTLRILQDRLPTLLQSPLPQEVLSPNITLHLFPSTHPHLPTVSGRVAYVAALWSSPIAFNRLPLFGNIKLEILAERMVRDPVSSRTRPPGAYGEQLIVRWRTVGKSTANGSNGSSKHWFPWFVGFGNGDKGSETKRLGGNTETDVTEYKAPVGNAQASGSSKKEFTGLFIFDFDKEGKILSHTIEHVQEGGQWEKGVGAKVVGLTDWLLGGMKGGDEPCPAFARARLFSRRR
ncbi:hypothetical protein QBC35DRAFT_429056 [Podospora australis]|uniref:Chromosome transmission fidelity protein 4 n=1 Tax=Podospora australis TaxID=1536484 RepID=A0AAN6WXU4_9PEZI|nr:hypothetical protein QBC35DRAFT_429056 [Podospora australis]